MRREDKLALIRDTGVIAIMRARSSQQLIAAAEAIMAGGVRAIEVTMTTPGALDVIAEAKRRCGEDVLFGAGSVLDSETARATILAGADFVVGPAVSLAVIEMCRRYGIPVMPGAFTPTELLTAFEAGADFVKLFPAELGGPPLVKALLAPLPQVALVPVGGVDIGNTASYIRSGAAAVGVGSSLVNNTVLDRGDLLTLTERAAEFISEVRKARGGC